MEVKSKEEAQITNESALKMPATIRSAKASLLLYKLSLNRRFKHHMREDIEDLKWELARERHKNKNIKLCGLLELFLHLTVLFSLFVFFLFIVVRSR